MDVEALAELSCVVDDRSDGPGTSLRTRSVTLLPMALEGLLLLEFAPNPRAMPPPCP